MSRWWRAYADAVDDPKLQRLPAELFRTWFNLLCMASANDGRLPAIGDMAYKLRVKEGEAAKRVQALKDAGLLDEDETGVSPHNWDARQFKSDVSTDRVKRFRQRCGNEKRNVSVTASETETESDSSLRSQSASELRSQAERFYRSYPKHVDPRAAEKKFTTIVRAGADPEQIIAAAERYAAAHRIAGTDKQFIPAPAVWLNKGGYLSEDLPQAPRDGPAASQRPRVTALTALALGQTDATEPTAFDHFDRLAGPASIAGNLGPDRLPFERDDPERGREAMGNPGGEIIPPRRAAGA